MPNEFDKDFGYLLPFLDKISAAAKALKDPAARTELEGLMTDEKRRWNRARELLAGVAGKADNAARPAAKEEITRPPGSAAFTVGSLRSR